MCDKCKRDDLRQREIADEHRRFMEQNQQPAMYRGGTVSNSSPITGALFQLLSSIPVGG